MAKRYEIEDSEWERIKHLFTKAKTGRPPKWDDKTMLNAILWLARSDARRIKAFTADSANGVTVEF